MTNAFHYQNTFDDDLAKEFRNTLSNYSPLQLPNLLAWLDGLDKNTIIEQLDKVTEWKDKSGNENHATNSVSGAPSKQETGIYFAGNKFLNWDNISVFPENCTVFIAASFEAYNPTHSYPIADFDSTGNLARFVFRKLTTDQFNFFCNSGLNLSVDEPAAPEDTNAIFTLTRDADGKEGKIYIGGDLKGSDSYNSITTSQGSLNIGRSGSYGTPQYFRGIIHEIIAYSSLLSAEQRLKTELYLAQKHSLLHATI